MTLQKMGSSWPFSITPGRVNLKNFKQVEDYELPPN